MLDLFRRHSGGIVAKIILVLLIVSFAAWGIGDMLRSHGTNAEVARVGKVSFTTRDVQREMQADIQKIRAQLGKNYNSSLLKQIGLTEQVVGRMVSQEMIHQEIERLGIFVSDALVAEMIRHNSLFAGKDQKFNKEIFHTTLKQHNLTENEYIANIKNEMATRLLSQAVTASGDVPSIAVNVLLAAEAEKREIELYTVDVSNIKVAEPTDKELQEYYKSVASRYTIPEYRTVRFVTLDASHIDEVKVSEDELQKLFEERKADYELPATRSFEQLLYAEESDAEKAAVELKKGKTIKAVAKELPPINAGNTTIKGVTANALPEEIREPAFALKKDGISQPVQSSFGYHVLKLTDVNEPHKKTLDEVRTDLENELKPQKQNEALVKRSRELEDALAGGASLEEVAKEMGLPIQSFGPYDNMARAPDGERLNLPPLNNFAVLTFSTDEGADSSVTLGKPGVYYLLHVDKVQGEELPDIAKVKDELVKSWKVSRKETLEQAEAEEVAAKLADNKQRDAVLKSSKVSRVASGKISRSDTKLGGKELSAMFVQDVFSSSVGNPTNAFMLPSGSYVVAMVKSATMAPLLSPAALAKSEAATKLQGSIKNNMQQELMSQYMDSIADSLGVDVHHDVVTNIDVE